MPGVIKIVRDGNFLAVIATREYQAVKAMRALSAATKWRETARLPKQDNLRDVLTGLPSKDFTIFKQNSRFGFRDTNDRGDVHPALSGSRHRSGPHARWRNRSMTS